MFCSGLPASKGELRNLETHANKLPGEIMPKNWNVIYVGHYFAYKSDTRLLKMSIKC